MSGCKKYYTVNELAEELGFQYMTVWNWIKNKRLPSVRMGKEYKIPREEVEKRIATGKLLDDVGE